MKSVSVFIFKFFFSGVNFRKFHILISFRVNGLLHQFCMDVTPAGGRTPHMKGVGMLVVSLRGVLLSDFGLT